MRTSRLIDTLAADAATPPARLSRGFRAALAVAIVAAAAVFWVLLGPRPDALVAIGTVRFPLKFVVTALLGVAAAALALRLVRPGAEAAAARLALLAAPILLAAAVVAELVAVPRELWLTRLVGTNWLVCLVYVPTISALPLAAILWALRRGAPASPAWAGAVAGLLAGAVGATFYAAHCPDDSPLFVAVWYTLAIGIVAAVGAAIGSRVLRW